MFGPSLRRAAFALSVAVQFVAGCSSGVRQDENPDGQAMDAGMDGDLGTDSQIRTDAALSDAGLDTAPRSLDPEAACRAVILAQCRRYRACDDENLGDPRCDHFADLCPEYYFSAGSNRSAAVLEACLPEIERQSCTDMALGIRPSCLVAGDLLPGTPCAFASQCSTGQCSLSGRTCGTCSAGAVAATGESCAGARCSNPGDFCHSATLVCTPASAVVHAGAGAPCDLRATPPVACTGDLQCVAGAPNVNAGVCRAFPQMGQPCAVGDHVARPCAAGLKCSGPSEGTCVPVQACGTLTCEPGWRCVEADGGSGCVPPAPEGGPCTSTRLPTPPSCEPLTECVFEADSSELGVCRSVVTRGERCDETHLCRGSLLCTNGHCSPIDATTCGALPPPDAGSTR
jgi:hypothetical protein